MNNKIYLLVIEWDNFYDTKEFDSYAFSDLDSASIYMENLIDSIKIDFMERFECETEDQLLNEYLEITDLARGAFPFKSLYVEDDCNVHVYIEEKPIMKF